MRALRGVCAIAALSGCRTIDPLLPFSEVADTVRERTGQEIHWRTETSADSELAKRIEEQLQGELTLGDALKISLLNNPALQAEYEELGIAQSGFVRAGLLQNPVLSFERRFRGQAAEADVTQSFLELFLLPLRTKVAEAHLDSIKARLTQLVLEHAAKLKSAYYSLQAEQQLLEMREFVVNALAASYSAVSSLRRAGNASALDLQNEGSLLAEARLEAAHSRLRVLEERERLNVLLGAWGKNTGWTIRNRLPDIPGEELSLAGLESYAVGHRLDLQAARQDLDRLAAEAGIARYEALIPELSLTGHFEREPEGESTSGPSVVVPLPLFDWGRAAQAGGNAVLRQALRRYEALAIDIRSEVRVAYGRMMTARYRAEYFQREYLPFQRRTLEQTLLHYNAMFQGVIQLLQAKRSQIDAGRSYIETLREYWMSRTELERTLGGSLRGLPVTVAAQVPATAEVIGVSQHGHSSGAHHAHGE